MAARYTHVFSTDEDGIQSPTHAISTATIPTKTALHEILKIRLRFGGGIAKTKSFSKSSVVKDLEQLRPNVEETKILLASFEKNRELSVIKKNINTLLKNERLTAKAYTIMGHIYHTEANHLRRVDDISWLDKNKKARSHLRKAIKRNNFDGEAYSPWLSLTNTHLTMIKRLKRAQYVTR